VLESRIPFGTHATACASIHPSTNSASKNHAKPSYFIAGGSHINIPEPVHLGFRREDIEQQFVFQPHWL